MRRLHLAGPLGAMLALGPPIAASAKPIAPTLFCAEYPDAPACVGGLPACTFCHTSPPDRNVYGAQVAAALLPGQARPLSDGDFMASFGAALRAAEALDADGDQATNVDEIRAATLPADPRSKPAQLGPCDGTNPYYSLCRYDRSYVYKKLHIDFCGRPPTLEEREAFAALGEGEQDTAIDASLAGCLRTNHWIGKDGVVWRLAHRKVKPLQAIKSGENRGIIPLADYDDDYNLFVYANTGDRDVRAVLTADYFVERADGPQTVYSQIANLSSQSVPQNRRAGMMTTKWFLVYNVMFTAIPRTAAAQAYRAYLNLDIAKLEGMVRVPGEPVDYDDRGVQAEACRECHATLDPLTYPFTNYDGLTDTPFGSYRANRLARGFGDVSPRITDTPEAGSIFGVPVANLVEWGRVAAGSDAFAQAVVEDYWDLLIAPDPQGEERDEFVALWRALKTTHGYQVEPMLRALIRTEAYGAP